MVKVYLAISFRHFMCWCINIFWFFARFLLFFSRNVRRAKKFSLKNLSHAQSRWTKFEQFSAPLITADTAHIILAMNWSLLYIFNLNGLLVSFHISLWNAKKNVRPKCVCVRVCARSMCVILFNYANHLSVRCIWWRWWDSKWFSSWFQQESERIIEEKKNDGKSNNTQSTRTN